MASPQTEDGYTKIANELLDALCKIRIPGEARQILDVIFRKTYGWNKKEDDISLGQFAEATGLSKIHVCQNLKKLLKMNIITEKGNDLLPKKVMKAITYCLQKNYEEWTPLPKKVTLPKKVISVTEKGNKSLPKKDTTKDNTKDNTKEKKSYGEFAQFSDEEHAKLIEKFGQSETADMIERMNLYAAQIGKAKFSAKYKSHYATLLNWNRMEKRNGRGSSQNGNDKYIKTRPEDRAKPYTDPDTAF